MLGYFFLPENYVVVRFVSYLSMQGKDDITKLADP